MLVKGTISRVQRSRAGVTLIIETEMGLRGVELDRDLWIDIVRDFELIQPDDIIGWAVAYDPAHGDLEITGPGGDSSGG